MIVMIIIIIIIIIIVSTVLRSLEEMSLKLEKLRVVERIWLMVLEFPLV